MEKSLGPVQPPFGRGYKLNALIDWGLTSWMPIVIQLAPDCWAYVTKRREGGFTWYITHPEADCSYIVYSSALSVLLDVRDSILPMGMSFEAFCASKGNLIRAIDNTSKDLLDELEEEYDARWRGTPGSPGIT